ncbi:hypothetical protein QTO34_016322 [Cnephaeus nilssonii]|uniref:Uncharacterized protein n=1 Tax=Cnephaeus nilssonii TaxID=3371016 RepID=A0AA40I6T7_CNENI|nr:hypothetical protein QTO34_016322 [Eptesicus nilssonii]
MFWKWMPERTFIHKVAKSMSGFKPFKDRLAVSLWSNVAVYKLKPYDAELAAPEAPRAQRLYHGCRRLSEGLGRLRTASRTGPPRSKAKAGDLAACLLRRKAFRKPPQRRRLSEGLGRRRTARWCTRVAPLSGCGSSKVGELGACLLRHQAFQKPPPNRRLLKGLVHQRTGTQLHREKRKHVFPAVESIRQGEYDPEGPYTLPVPDTSYTLSFDLFASGAELDRRSRGCEGSLGSGFLLVARGKPESWVPESRSHQSDILSAATAEAGEAVSPAQGFWLSGAPPVAAPALMFPLVVIVCHSNQSFYRSASGKAQTWPIQSRH